MEDWKELDELLEKNNGSYINKWDVLFNWYAPGHLFVSARWSDYESEEDISLVYLCNVPKEFYEKFEIENVSQIDQVKVELLLKLFHTGDAMVVCGTDDESLEFEEVDGKLIANTGDSAMIHEVKEKLETPDDFAQYAKQYFFHAKGESSRRN